MVFVLSELSINYGISDFCCHIIATQFIQQLLSYTFIIIYHKGRKRSRKTININQISIYSLNESQSIIGSALGIV